MTARIFLRPSPFRTPVFLCGVLLTAGCKANDLDLDGDGFVASEDCDDGSSSIRPSATEQCNAIDDDCDGDIDEGVLLHYQLDADGDGYGTEEEVMACSGTPNTATNTFDCDDSDPDVHPKAPEICANDEDEDCDGQDLATETWYADADEDGFGDPATTVEECNAPSGFVEDATDCDDADSAIHPGAVETCDGIDGDCNGNDCLGDDATICSSELAEPDAVLPEFRGSCGPEDGFVEFGGHCYLFVETAVAWRVARANCMQAGGYLATVADEDENAFIDEHTNLWWPWLGGCDADDEGTWTWITGEPWAYEYWGLGEPNGTGEPGEDCLQILVDASGARRWNDWFCTSGADAGSYAYVCEFELADSP